MEIKFKRLDITQYDESYGNLITFYAGATVNGGSYYSNEFRPSLELLQMIRDEVEAHVKNSLEIKIAPDLEARN